MAVFRQPASYTGSCFTGTWQNSVLELAFRFRIVEYTSHFVLEVHFLICKKVSAMFAKVSR